MRIIYYIILQLLVILQSNTIAADMASKFNSAVTQFSAKFVNELEKNKSVVSSPLSAKFVLALVALGSSGEGHDELLSALGLSSDDEIREVFSHVSSKLKAVKGVTLSVANKVYVMEGPYDLQSPLKEDAVKVFDAAFEKVDFSNGSAAANTINQWVEGQTNNKIKDLLSGDSLDSLTRLVLINAIYFKGTWSKKFNSQFTSDQPFYGVGGETQVPMMYKEDDYRYGESEELQAQLVELSYVGNEASMVVVLPYEHQGLDALLKKLADGHNLMSDIEQMYSTKVQVSIPKFKIETEIDLNSLLPKLGIKRIFDQTNSGLTKILNTNEELYVSKAVQKAFIEVNEEGAEAAAATGMVMMMRCARPPSPTFRADRPFIYILATKDKTPLFMGVFNGKA